MKFSIIIPLYNRPQELDELLDTLTRQTCKNFEVVIVEDGSTIKGDEIAEKYSTELDIKYFEKENEGPGLTRNYGAERATGDFFVFFDSDCLIPENYLKTVIQHLEKNPVDCYGGPDRAHESFTNLQKAINYTMTSFFTTGGIRGSKNTVEKFHPRTFNIGFSKQLFQETGGFSSLRISEDIEFSKRITSLGYTTGLIPEAFVYHKRRTSLGQFYKQVYKFGGGRINIYKLYRQGLKITHAFPSLFLLFTLISMLAITFLPHFMISRVMVFFVLLYLMIILTDSSIKNKSIMIGMLSVVTLMVQFSGYGLGFIKGFIRKIIFNEKVNITYPKPSTQ